MGDLRSLKSKVKGIAAVILCVLILISAFVLPASATDDELSVIVMSDSHMISAKTNGDIQSHITIPDYPLQSHADKNGKLYAESEAVLSSFLDEAAKSDAEYVLIPGDVVDGGDSDSFARAASLLKKFESRTNKEVFVISGNHEYYFEVGMSTVESYYKSFGYSQAIARDTNSLSYVADLGKSYRLIAIDSCIIDHNINEELLTWVETQAAKAKADGKYPIAMMHHNVVEHMTGTFSDLYDEIFVGSVANKEIVSARLADAGIKYIFTGHTHLNDISSTVTEAGNEIFDVVTASLIAYPCPYRTVKFTEENVTFATKYVTSIDTSLLPRGYSEEQLELIKNDFPTYAEGMITASAKKTLSNLLLNPEALMDRLSINRSGAAGKLIGLLAPKLYDAIAMPLYKTDETNGKSVEEVAAKAGYILPESDYYDVFGVGTGLIKAHICGDENIPADSVEVTLLFDCVKAALVETIAGYEDTISSVITALKLPVETGRLTSYASALAFRQSLAAEIAGIILDPMIEGMSIDTAPADNNTVLPAYAAAASTTASGKWESLAAKIMEILEYISQILNAILNAFTR